MPELSKYPILRSGFITFQTGGLKRPTHSFDKSVLSMLGKVNQQPDTLGFYHATLHQLYVAMARNMDTPIVNDLSVQTKMFLNAAEAFGTKNFADWIRLQSENPCFTSDHQAFLLETLDYLDGKRRKLRVVQWIRLLEHRDRVCKSITNHETYRRRMEQGLNRLSSHRLSEVLVRWARQPDGLYDLLSTLAVIFGNRRYSTGEVD